MAGVTEVREHMRSVSETVKITNAMYLISSSKLKKARKQLDEVKPYFEKLQSTIADILRHSPDMNHPYFDKRPEVEVKKRGYVVITADKGLAGAYNHNVLKMAEAQLQEPGEHSLYVVGQAGRNYFNHRKIPIDAEFLYTAQDPTVPRARDISDLLVNFYNRGLIDECYITYTHMVSPLLLQPRTIKILPLDKEAMTSSAPETKRYRQIAAYIPSVNAVLDNVVPGYVKGIIFGALVESFSSEQSARMTAMDAATKNAREMIKSLSLEYNRARQAAITQEISEIVGGADGQRQQ